MKEKRIKLFFDDSKRAYYLDHEGRRWFFECKLVPDGADFKYNQTGEEIASLAMAVLSGKISVESL